jgi:hypothetical protein
MAGCQTHQILELATFGRSQYSWWWEDEGKNRDGGDFRERIIEVCEYEMK